MPIVRPTRIVARRAAGALAAAGVLALVVVGCTAAPSPTTEPTPSADAADPIFASDEEALAAAEASYERYRALAAEVSQDGGERAERVEAAVTPDYAVSLHEEFATLRELGLHMQGSTTIDTASIAEWYVEGGIAHVSLYLCRDVSGTRVIGPDGQDVTPSDRPDRTALLAALVSGGGDPKDLLVDGVEVWPGDDFC